MKKIKLDKEEIKDRVILSDTNYFNLLKRVKDYINILNKYEHGVSNLRFYSKGSGDEIVYKSLIEYYVKYLLID